ncbi:MAG TPA: serine hydrolase [Longimicrobiales bacterium]|nr:serine hydrolase [Longimicrobiales bacterium]
MRREHLAGRHRRIWGLTLAAFVAVAGSVQPASSQPVPLQGLDEYIIAAMQAWEVPGLAVAVVRNDSVIYSRGFGVRQHGTTDPVDEHTLFPIASTTKAMTTAALGTLVDEDRLDWDDAVADHLPWFRLADPYVSDALTVRDLLTHRAGLSRSDNLWIAAPYQREEVLRRARHLPIADFRGGYGYNNIMYIAAGELAGAVAGMSWDDLLEQRLFRPLGMTRSTTRAAVVDGQDNVAVSHTKPGGVITAMARRNYDNIGGAGAAWSTAHDMARWLRLHLGDGTVDGRRLLEPSTLAELHTPQVVIRMDTVARRMFPATHFRAYGLGWNLQDYHGRKMVHHSGSINYTRTQIGMIPEEGIGVVVMANLSTSNAQVAIMYRVLDALLGLSERDWTAEYLELTERSEAATARQAAQVEATRVAGTQPSLAVEAYAGTYRHPVFGDVVIGVEQGRLVLRYAPEYVADLEHWHHDTFRGTWRSTGFGTAFVSFALDSRARPATLELEGFGVFRRQ